MSAQAQPLVTETAARADLAAEYGVLFANYRNAALEVAALVTRLGTMTAACSEALAREASLNAQLAKVTEQHEELANQLRGKVLPARRKV